MQTLLDEGRTWVVDADIKSYFDQIPKDRLMGRVEERIADGRVVARAAEALGLLDHVAAEPALLSLLRHADPDVRGSAAEALGRVGLNRDG